jgi:hypothetical protein
MLHHEILITLVGF